MHFQEEILNVLFGEHLRDLRDEFESEHSLVAVLNCLVVTEACRVHLFNKFESIRLILVSFLALSLDLLLTLVRNVLISTSQLGQKVDSFIFNLNHVWLTFGLNMTSLFPNPFWFSLGRVDLLTLTRSEL